MIGKGVTDIVNKGETSKQAGAFPLKIVKVDNYNYNYSVMM